MTRYELYKKASYDWLKNIPFHWEELFLEQVAQEKLKKNSNNDISKVLSLSYGSIKVKKDLNKGLISKDLSTYQIVEPGDIIMRLTDLQNDHKSLRTGLVNDKGIITAAYLCLSPKINSRYLHYLLHSYDTLKVFYGMGGGVRQSIGFKDIRHMYLPVPPRTEQEQIVRFLDWKVSEINKLIGIRKQEVVELKDLASSIIEQAITKGIDNGIVLNKTGIYYLPEIPNGWEFLRLKHICKIGASISKMVKKYADQDKVVFLPMEKISTNGKVDCSLKLPLGQVKSGFSSFAKGDVIVAKITPCFENGKGACLNDLESDIGYGTTELYNLRPQEKLLSEYLYYITMTKLFRVLGEGRMTGSAGQKRVPVDFIKNFMIGIPSIQEQQRIINYIKQKTRDISNLIAIKEDQVQELLEAKNSIISDVVTGKIDVRNVEIPEYEHIDDVVDDGEENEEELADAEETEL